MGHIINAKEEIYYEPAERLSKTPEGAPINEGLWQFFIGFIRKTKL